MDKLSRSQLPDSSSSPPMSSIFQNFDDDGMSDLPSCVYANAHHHHQLNAGQISINNMSATGSQTSAASNLRMNTNAFRQIHQHFIQHADVDPPSTSSEQGNFSGQVKALRQQQAPARERKRTLRTAPNG